MGYNIFFSNPHSTEGLDPGYYNFNIIDLSYDPDIMNTLNGDRNWIVPKGVRSNTFNTCTSSYSSNSVNSMEQYRSNLKASVEVSGKYPVASFSVNAEYRKMEQSIKNQESLFIESQAECVLFDLGFYTSKSFQPTLTNDIVEILKTLESKGANQEAYYDFFDKYGTHVVTKVKLGSLFGYRFEMHLEEVQKMKSSGFDVEASASAFCGKGSLGISRDVSSQNMFKDSMKTWKQYSTGAFPDSDNDVSKWASQTIDNPMPVSLSLTSFDYVLDIYTKSDKKGFTYAQLRNLKIGFAYFLGTYCQNRLVKTGRIGECIDSTAKVNDFFDPKNASAIDKMTINGRLPVLIENFKSSRFIKAKPNSSQLGQYYYDGSPEFLFLIRRVDQTLEQYQVIQQSSGLCIQPYNCQLGDDTNIILATCQQILCQQWKITPISANNLFYKFKNVNSQKFMITYGRLETEANNMTQYYEHDCQLCDNFIIYRPR